MADAPPSAPEPGPQAESAPESAAEPVSQPRPADPIAVPVPRPAKPRLFQDGRDMFWSMAPLVVACIVLAGVLGMCSFNPKGPTIGKPPSYDAHSALVTDARQFGFPIREPALPSGWQANSGRRDGIDAGRADASGHRARAVVSMVGYVGPSGAYMSVAQSDADEEKLVAWQNNSVVAHGVEDVSGTRWVVYEGGDGTEPVWATRLAAPAPGTTVAITGAGTPDDFRAVARAVQSAAPL